MPQDIVRSFVIEDYHRQRPFSSFLPGVAGERGVPIWAFYVNRGQGICSFGYEDKNHAFMEFLPANQAYQLVTRQGFRTCLTFTGAAKIRRYEPFQYPEDKSKIRQKMLIRAGNLRLLETHPVLGLETAVEYFPVTGENYGALVRRLTIKNISAKTIRLRVTDGLPVLVPYGIDDESLKYRRYLMEAFITTEWVHPAVPMFRIKVEQKDSPDVTEVQAGHFSLCFSRYRGRDKLMRPVVDPEKFFGPRKDFDFPDPRPEAGKDAAPGPEMQENHFPCALIDTVAALKPGEEYGLNYILGKTDDKAAFRGAVPALAKSKYLERAAARNETLIAGLVRNSLTVSGHEVFDQYSLQNYLDNTLRGGYPESFRAGGAEKTFYLYHRKHGDLERDYNQFKLAETYYSQGTTNYRDVNQNRRNDLYFNPDLGEENILRFLNLLQLDGYNPHHLKDVQFRLEPAEAQALLEKYAPKKEFRAIVERTAAPFLPGVLVLGLEKAGLLAPERAGEFFAELLSKARMIENAEHGDGFWIDHWTYNLDLIESYLRIYPERLRRLLMELKEFTFFDNAKIVQPRSVKYRVVDGRLMQLNAVTTDAEKERMIRERREFPNRVRAGKGLGDVYKTTLTVKLLAIIANGLASLDPSGIGVEMEADKPGWCDALNGLPGQFGSSVCETFELKRLALWLRKNLAKAAAPEAAVPLPAELAEWMRGLSGLSAASAVEYWDRSHTLKEQFRADTRLGLDGREEAVTVKDILEFLDAGVHKLETGIRRAFDETAGIYRSYFTHHPADWKPAEGGTGVVIGKTFKRAALPFYLEGNVHAFRVEADPERLRELHRRLKQSPLYDKRLKMYKINAPLAGESLNIGRARAFTPGWLENESIWLHMEYKYLLELLKQGLTEEFYREVKTTLVPFLPFEQYGRSLYENSSFITSSAHPDRKRHGKGYYARLSGSTAEFIHMWLLMSAGPKPFVLDAAGALNCRLAPLLPAWLFTKAEREIEYVLDGKPVRVTVPRNAYGFMFLGRTFVVYHNPKRKDTFGRGKAEIERVELLDMKGKKWEIAGALVPAPWAQAVRERAFARIDVYMK